MFELLIDYVLLLVHVITATVWFGLAMRIGHHARLVSSVERQAATELAARTQVSVRLAGLFILLPLALSLSALLIRSIEGAFGVVSWAAMALLALVGVIHYALAAPTWRKMNRAVSIGEPSQLATLPKARKRLLAVQGVERVLWLVVLVMVGWRALTGGP